MRVHLAFPVVSLLLVAAPAAAAPVDVKVDALSVGVVADTFSFSGFNTVTFVAPVGFRHLRDSESSTLNIDASLDNAYYESRYLYSNYDGVITNKNVLTTADVSGSYRRYVGTSGRGKGTGTRFEKVGGAKPFVEVSAGAGVSMIDFGLEAVNARAVVGAGYGRIHDARRTVQALSVCKALKQKCDASTLDIVVEAIARYHEGGAKSAARTNLLSDLSGVFGGLTGAQERTVRAVTREALFETMERSQGWDVSTSGGMRYVLTEDGVSEDNPLDVGGTYAHVFRSGFLAGSSVYVSPAYYLGDKDASLRSVDPWLARLSPYSLNGWGGAAVGAGYVSSVSSVAGVASQMRLTTFASPDDVGGSLGVDFALGPAVVSVDTAMDYNGSRALRAGVRAWF